MLCTAMSKRDFSKYLVLKVMYISDGSSTCILLGVVTGRRFTLRAAFYSTLGYRRLLTFLHLLSYSSRGMLLTDSDYGLCLVNDSAPIDCDMCPQGSIRRNMPYL